MTTSDAIAAYTRSEPITVRSVGRLYTRPGRLHGNIVERVDVTTRRLGGSVYLDIDGANRSLCYQLTWDQFTALTGVLDAPEAGR